MQSAPADAQRDPFPAPTARSLENPEATPDLTSAEFSPIAIVGLAGRFPGASGLDEFWQHLLARHDAASEPPLGRWCVSPEQVVNPHGGPDRAYHNRGSFLSDFSCNLDGLAISPRRMEGLDPLFHLVLQVGAEAFRSARLETVDRRRIGIVLANIALPTEGATAYTRQVLETLLLSRALEQVGEPELLQAAQELAKATRISSGADAVNPDNAAVMALPAGLLAEALGIEGGSYTLDAACASSLYALYLACLDLQSFRLDTVLSGGASMAQSLYTQVGFTQLQALSRSGVCRPFDQRADGLMVGEGAGIFVLKRLADAERAGDTIHGVIRGIGVSNDVAGSLLSPASEGQLRAMRQAYARAGWAMGDVELIECHGTGTPRGDAVELESLKALCQEGRASSREAGGNSATDESFGNSAGKSIRANFLPPAIGSVKANIGHLLTGAGAAGLMKILLAIRHQTLPPHANVSAESLHPTIAEGMFRVLESPEPWPSRDGDLPRAAVSGFGFGGINAHLLVEGYRANTVAHVTTAMTDSVESSGEEKRAPTRADENNDLKQKQASSTPIPLAIVGMGAQVGTLNSLESVRDAFLEGRAAFAPPPAQRFDGLTLPAALSSLQGAWIERLELPKGQFKLPPGEIPSLLPQQAIMLQVAAAAISDLHSTMPLPRLRMGVVMGLTLDLESTRFFLRWHLPQLLGNLIETLPAGMTDLDALVEQLLPAFGPALDAARTLGALGGMVASRVARELQTGGPSFGVSGEGGSGLRALEVAARLIQAGDVDSVLVGAVELAGDLRTLLRKQEQWSVEGITRPFDEHAQGTLPGEGAAALVLKRLDHALEQGDRIYAVVKGIGASSAAEPSQAHAEALARAWEEAGASIQELSLIETPASGCVAADREVMAALNHTIPASHAPIALGSVHATVGDTGAVSGLLSVIKAALELHHRILAPVPGFHRIARSDTFGRVTSDPALRDPNGAQTVSSPFHIPISPLHWLQDRAQGLRLAGVMGSSDAGTQMHVVLEEAPLLSQQLGTSDAKLVDPPQSFAHRLLPMRDPNPGIFVLEAPDANGILQQIDVLRVLIQASSKALFFLAKDWFLSQHTDASLRKVDRSASHLYHALVATDRETLLQQLEMLSRTSAKEQTDATHRNHLYQESGQVAFVFPGSGNHYPGMGRELLTAFPQIAFAQDLETTTLQSQLTPRLFAPWRTDWSRGWERSAMAEIQADPQAMIFGQVSYGIVMSDVARLFAIHPAAWIGYSLGESAALFSSRAWTARDTMYQRTLESPLFRSQLSGAMTVAQAQWGTEVADWSVMVVNRGREEVLAALTGTAALLIVNAPGECVVGGRRADVAALVQKLGCASVPLEGVPTVHCSVMAAVSDAYYALHALPTQSLASGQPLRIYSGAWATPYVPTEESAAASILANAQNGFDFPKVIERAYADGIRIFVEPGPQNSCSRMIRRILHGRPHRVVSLCQRGQPALRVLLQGLATLIEAGVPVSLEPFFAESVDSLRPPSVWRNRPTVSIEVGAWAQPVQPSQRPKQMSTQDVASLEPPGLRIIPPMATEDAAQEVKLMQQDAFRAADVPTLSPSASQQLAQVMLDAAQAAGRAHDQFLSLAQQSMATQLQVMTLQQELIESLQSPEMWHPFQRSTVETDHFDPMPPSYETSGVINFDEIPAAPAPQFDRDMCLEFAIGSLQNMLGPLFAEVDSFPSRVRLPDEPLMLVDRILSVEGTMGTPGPGRVVTEHDVLPDAWYLDGGRAPVCISVEAGQADLFLSGYLGIDLLTRGERVYRLLDAQIVFHRDLPTVGETIRYDIHIDRFIRQGETWMFFFHFEGFIGDQHLISMTDGCAGFFSIGQLESGKGIVSIPEGIVPPRRLGLDGNPTRAFTSIVPMAVESYSDAQLDALRQGELEVAFGAAFAGIQLAPSLRLPGGTSRDLRMRLVDRILNLDPVGGRFGLGMILGEADIAPDAWFLTCHFSDDPVMPGTLMYECCLHTLRVLLLRMGWVVSENPADALGVRDLHYAPVCGIASKLKCRGQVIPSTQKVQYQIELKEIGYDPAPYVIADALMIADGKAVVWMENMSARLEGATQETLHRFKSRGSATSLVQPGPALYSQEEILAYAIGNPSEAFGERYRIFDTVRRLARLPGPPFCFVSRILDAGPAPWELTRGGFAEAQYDVPPDAWYFRANRQPVMPFAILLEIALQPCGWLAAYLGSALRSELDLHFRNLEGEAVLHRALTPDIGTLTMRTRLTDFSEAGGMIIQRYELSVWAGAEVLYEGWTRFGFFPSRALAQQVGIRGARDRMYVQEITGDSADTGAPLTFAYPSLAPWLPEDGPPLDEALTQRGPQLPGRALRMIDTVSCFVPDGGPAGLGYIAGTMQVDPDAWFFKAHFYQDPVIPGSLGLEAFLQLLKVVALHRWQERLALEPGWQFEPITVGRPHQWFYRGQIIPTDTQVTVEAVITGIEEGERLIVTADGFLQVDGRVIYEMKHFGIALVRGQVE